MHRAHCKNNWHEIPNFSVATPPEFSDIDSLSHYLFLFLALFNNVLLTCLPPLITQPVHEPGSWKLSVLRELFFPTVAKCFLTWGRWLLTPSENYCIIVETQIPKCFEATVLVTWYYLKIQWIKLLMQLLSTQVQRVSLYMLWMWVLVWLSG